MKIKLSALTFALLFISFGCMDFTDELGAEPTLESPPPKEYTNPLNGSSTFPTQLKVTNYSTLSSDLTSAAGTINSNPSLYWSTLDNGLRYTNFSGYSWPYQADYIKRVHVTDPPADYLPMTETEFKAYVASELPKLGMSSSFNVSTRPCTL